LSPLICPGEVGAVNLRPRRETAARFYNGDLSSPSLQRTTSSLLETQRHDNLLPDARVRPSALALSSSFSSPAEYYGDAASLAAVPRLMRHSAGVNASSYRDFVYQQQQQASRVPPTPPGHSRPFTRSSSVPDQGSYYDSYFSDLDDGLGLGLPPLSTSASDRFKSPSSSSRFPDWRTGSYSISSALRARGQRGLRLGRQFSVSSELPTTDPTGRYPPQYPYVHDPRFDPALHGSHLLTTGGGPLGGGIGSSAVRDHDVLLHSRSPPLTLGRSLQLVTENFGRYSSSSAAAAAADRRKKTVRFNSEEWGRQAAAAAAAAGYPGNPYLVGPSSSSQLLSSVSGRYIDSCLFGGADDDDSWMSIEDVRSGRWARWDALRQESQDSQTRDSGIETGSCFTSSEDSNRGGDIYLSKKVDCNTCRSNCNCNDNCFTTGMTLFELNLPK